MEFREGAGVFGPDGKHLGALDRVVIDPRTRKVTHLVIHRGHLFGEDRVAPVERVSVAEADSVIIDADPAGLPLFEEKHYVPLDKDSLQHMRLSYESPYLWYGSLRGTPHLPFTTKAPAAERHIPEGEVAVAKGAIVLTPHGEHAGTIDEIITDPGSGVITHIVIRSGHLRERRRLEVPVGWIARFEDDAVHLAVGLKTLASIPENPSE
jgi:sporulation protein YlmC with PRC-barrel domain